MDLIKDLKEHELKITEASYIVSYSLQLKGKKFTRQRHMGITNDSDHHVIWYGYGEEGELIFIQDNELLETLEKKFNEILD